MLVLGLGLGLKAKKIGPWPWDSKSLAVALALMSLALLTITVMSIMSLSIVLMLQLLSQLQQLQDFHHQLRNLECHSLNIIQPAKHLLQMHDNWSDSWRIIWTISMHHHSIVSKTACQTFVKRVTSPLCCHFLNECCVLQQVRNQWSEYFRKVA